MHSLSIMFAINLMWARIFWLERQVTVTLAGQGFWSAEDGRQSEMIWLVRSVRLCVAIASLAIMGEHVAVALGWSITMLLVRMRIELKGINILEESVIWMTKY